ncbi:MAG TPA: histidine ammonia-lyase, partial [Candidatus Obscuribacterales bacterium]
FLKEERVVYGITTGFGKFKDIFIRPEDSSSLQRNLLLSHAAGVGPRFDDDTVRAIMLLRANALAKGYSGIRPDVVELLLSLLNERIHPVVPQQGSLGASGDLAPLAHLALVLIGAGEASLDGEIMDGETALNKKGLKSITLGAKEGLALINGTQVMSAVGTLTLLEAEHLAKIADIVGAMALEAQLGSEKPFAEVIHEIRPHKGQAQSAKNLRNILRDSELMESHADCPLVQDAYSLRCMPQVHGASRQAFHHVRQVLETEINSATDNPLVFDGYALSGGNFHGQPLALALDYLGIAIAELANISERRTERLVNPALSNGLPAFLTHQGGLHSGFMIAQYTAAALVSENKVLAHPASVDSIPTNANQEDHVSMGMISARKARTILENTRKALAIELLAASQGLDFRTGNWGKPLRHETCPPDKPQLMPGKGVDAAYRFVRKHIDHMDQDREIHRDFQIAEKLIASGELLKAVEAEVGALE